MKKEIYKKKLKNGVTVLFMKRKIPVVSVALAVKYGSGFENEKDKGLAHFIEHMLFKGTKKRSSEQIHQEIEDKGGEHNAFTAKTFTTAWMKLPSKYLEFSIEILSDMFYNSVFDLEEIEKERKAILEEIKMYHDEPSRYVFEGLQNLMYKKPFSISGLGTAKNVSRFSREDLVKRYKEVYFSGNFVLAVVGDTSFDKIVNLAENYFTKTSGKRKVLTPIKTKGVKVEKRKEIEQAHLAFGIHFPSLKDKDRYAAEVFHSFFSSGASSKIFKEVREKRGLAYAVVGMLEQEAGHGEELVYVGALKEKVREVKKIIIKEFKKMSKISKKEVEKIKTKLINSRILEKENSRNILMGLLLEESAGNAEEYCKYESKIKKVNLKDVRKLAKLKSFSTFSLVPD